MRNLPFIALFAAACVGPTAPVTIEEAHFDPSLNVDLSKSTKTPFGVYYRDLVAGSGTPLANGQVISVRYVGALTNGQVFDSNPEGVKPLYKFQLGAGTVIPGWDDGLVGATVGGTRQLIIPPEMGYGPYAA